MRVGHPTIVFCLERCAGVPRDIPPSCSRRSKMSSRNKKNPQVSLVGRRAPEDGAVRLLQRMDHFKNDLGPAFFLNCWHSIRTEICSSQGLSARCILVCGLAVSTIFDGDTYIHNTIFDGDGSGRRVSARAKCNDCLTWMTMRVGLSDDNFFSRAMCWCSP